MPAGRVDLARPSGWRERLRWHGPLWIEVALSVDCLRDRHFAKVPESVMQPSRDQQRWVGIGGLFGEAILSNSNAAGIRSVLIDSDLSFSYARASEVRERLRPLDHSSQEGAAE